MSSADATVNATFPVLCIPRAMLFHTAEFVENAFNLAMHGKFVKNVAQTKTIDKSGTEFNVFFIHPDQDFKANRATDLLYANLRTQGVVNISTGQGNFFWKVKLYVPNLKAQYLPQPPAPVAPAPPAPVAVGPRIMSVEDVEEFEQWRREKAAAKAAAEKAAAEARAAEEAAARDLAELNAIGERLYPVVVEILAEKFPKFKHAGKITGMILEMPRPELVALVGKEGPAPKSDELHRLIREAVEVLRQHFLEQAGCA
jgi:hypothetical protein